MRDTQLYQEMIHWLDEQMISSENIGFIRRQLFMPFATEWNSIVRVETAQRENVYPQNLSSVTSTVKKSSFYPDP